MDNFLLDKDFLAQLDQQRMKTTYARIILLTWEEEPVYEIQGKIIHGSVNIDGEGAVRRTCSLTMVTPDINMNNTYWALKNKFKLEIGVKNIVNSQYPEICWFKQGIFCFTSINMSNQINNFTIAIEGQDKMCLLNGSLGGAITAETDFGQLEEQTILGNGEYLYDLTGIPVKSIIKNTVHFFAGQPLEDIVINDVDDYGLELLEYRAKNSTLYMIRNKNTGEIENVTTKGSATKYYMPSGKMDKDGLPKPKSIYLKDIEYPYLQMESFDYNNSGEEDGEYQATVFYSSEDDCKKDNNPKQVIKVGQYDTAGYRLTDLTYPGKLVAKVGENLESILDKIKKMFSCFEYFFDVDGRFVFQKKKTYQNDTWTPLKKDSDKSTYALDAAYSSSSVYQFENNRIIMSCSNKPDILNLKNDYSIWGSRAGVGDATIPIHLRYAIEFKPNYYISERREKQIDDTYKWKRRLFIVDDYSVDDKIRKKIPNFDSLKDSTYIVDWRELIYQMALDYYNLNEWSKSNKFRADEISSYTELLISNNPETCAKGRTGYENFYTDQQGFWRQLYMPAILEDYDDLFSTAEKREAARWYWYKELGNTTEPTKKNINNIIKNKKLKWRKYFTKDFDEDTGYAIAYQEQPEVLNYYFDFMDAKSNFGQYAISSIGDRVKVINDDKITSIYFKETPTVLFVSQSQKSELSSGLKQYSQQQGYTLVNLTSQMERYFTISAQGKTAWDELQSQMYQYTNLAESITLTAAPIYYLEPNNRILIKNDNADINGEYIVTKITIPLEFNGTTSITATKAVERIY